MADRRKRNADQTASHKPITPNTTPTPTITFSNPPPTKFPTAEFGESVGLSSSPPPPVAWVFDVVPVDWEIVVREGEVAVGTEVIVVREAVSDKVFVADPEREVPVAEVREVPRAAQMPRTSV